MGVNLKTKGRTISVPLEIRPWTSQLFPVDNGYAWQDLFPEGLDIFKLVKLPRPLERGTLERLLEEGKVRLPRNSSVEHECLSLALEGTVQFPNGLDSLTMENLFSKLNDEPRENLTALYKFERPGRIIVPRDSGIIARLNIRPGNYYLGLEIEQGKGVTHSAASIISPHTGPSHVIELLGNGVCDVEATRVRANLYPIETKQQPKQIIVPDLNLEGRPKHEKFGHAYIANFVNPQEQSSRITVAIDESDAASIQALDDLLREQPDPVSAVFYHFPSKTHVMTALQNVAMRGKLKSLVFSVPPMMGVAFGEKEYSQIRELNELGAHVVWNSKELGYLVFHDTAFMRPETIPEFDIVKASGTILAIYGSQYALDEREANGIEELVKGTVGFAGGPRKVMIVTGGGPGAMRGGILSGKKYGTLTAAVSITKENEAKAHIIDGEMAVDAYMPFTKQSISVRQNSMKRMAKIVVITMGGDGTDSEFDDAHLLNGLSHSSTPIFFTNGEYHRHLLAHKRMTVEMGRASPFALSQIVTLDDPRRFKEGLLDFYSLE